MNTLEKVVIGIFIAITTSAALMIEWRPPEKEKQAVRRDDIFCKEGFPIKEQNRFVCPPAKDPKKR